MEINLALVKDLLIGVAGILLIIAIIISLRMIRKGNINSLSLSKNGISVEGKNKTVKLYNVNNLLNEAIKDIDGKMIDFAIHQADLLRRELPHFLEDYIHYPFGKRAISSAIRHPLYNAARRNNFRTVLTYQNITQYIDGIMSEIKLDYADVELEQSTFSCPLHNAKCVELPKWDDLKKPVRELLIEKWVYPIKNQRIKASQDKIDTYKKYIDIFRELGDENQAEVAQQKIAKNEKYINALKNRGEVS